MPTLVVHGLADPLVPPERGRHLAALIPGARLALIRACGHLLMTDAEHQTASAILKHLHHSRDADKSLEKAEISAQR
jgi:10-carbomethoxy-13-deoxycarminomycin esterase/esterase